MDHKPGSYTFSGPQMALLNGCVNARRGSIFWALMYMQSRLFHAENVDSIYNALQLQYKQYEYIMSHYYQIRLDKEIPAGSPLYRYYPAYLNYLDGRRRNLADEIRLKWLELDRQTAAQLALLNPFWDSSVWGTLFVHNTELLCQAADQDLLGNYRAISNTYLVLDRLAREMGEYMGVGIIRQFQIE